MSDVTHSNPFAAPHRLEAVRLPAPPAGNANGGGETSADLTITGQAGPGAPDEVEAVPQDLTIRELLEWVGDDLDRAQRALDAEHDRPTPRKRAIADLEEMLTAT